MGNLYSSSANLEPVQNKLTHKTSKEYTPKLLLGNNILVCGQSGSGKTSLIKYLYSILSNTLSETYVYGDYKTEFNEDFYKKDVDIDSINFNSGTRYFFIVNSLYDRKVISQEGFMKAMFNNNCTVIVDMMYPSLALSPVCRSQFNLTYFAHDDVWTNKKRIYDYYAGFYPTFTDFVKSYDKLLTVGERFNFFTVDRTIDKRNKEVYSYELDRRYL